MATIILTGGTGFLGRHITTALRARGHNVLTISRGARGGVSSDVQPWEALPDVVQGAQAVINLAGSNVGGARWSAKVRHEILASRLASTRAVVDALRRCPASPPALINASAVGYYGNTMVPSNEAMPAGQTFLANVVRQWEEAAEEARSVTRVALMRIGVVLDASEGALPRLVLPMRLGIGGPLGSGRQWFPWVHRNDVVEAFCWASEDDGASGPYNVVAPEAVTMSGFTHALGNVLHRPSWLPVPTFALRLLLGRQADIVVHGQYVVPQRLLGGPFRFQHPGLDEALRHLLANTVLS